MLPVCRRQSDLPHGRVFENNPVRQAKTRTWTSAEVPLTSRLRMLQLEGARQDISALKRCDDGICRRFRINSRRWFTVRNSGLYGVCERFVKRHKYNCNFITQSVAAHDLCYQQSADR